MSYCSTCSKQLPSGKKAGRCSECNKVYMKEYRKNNLDKVKAGQKDHYLRNSDKVKNKVREYRIANPERVKQSKARTYQNRREWYLRKSEEYAENNAEAVKENKRRYHIANAEKMCEKSRVWYRNNLERVKEYRFRYRQNNKERIKLGIKAWVENNKERYQIVKRTHGARYRASKKGAGGSHTVQDIRAMYDAQNGKCAVCFTDISRYYEVDHVLPLSRGGSNSPGNLQLLCLRCNRSKGSKTMDEFINHLERKNKC